MLNVSLVLVYRKVGSALLRLRASGVVAGFLPAAGTTATATAGATATAVVDCLFVVCFVLCSS